MKLEELQKAMIAAMKAKDKPRKESISALVSAVKKAGIDANIQALDENMVETAERGGGKDDSDRKICRCAGYEEQRDDHEGGHGRTEGKGRREGDQPGGGRADEVAASSCIYIKS